MRSNASKISNYMFVVNMYVCVNLYMCYEYVISEFRSSVEVYKLLFLNDCVSLNFLC